LAEEVADVVAEEVAEEVSEEVEDSEDDGLKQGDIVLAGDEKEPEDYVEEKTTADGTHIRKEVH
jgi:hypothetical protein